MPTRASKAARAEPTEEATHPDPSAPALEVSACPIRYGD